jgi:hypothetical protein
MERRNAGATVGAIALLSLLVACQTQFPTRAPLLVPIQTDSAEVGVHFNQNTYFAKIGFSFVNDTGKPLSRAGCGGPGWPALEKKVDGLWVPAYYQVYLLCRSYPDFFLPPGAPYRSELDFMAFEPGHNKAPELLVKTIDGVYRLHWGFVAAQNADEKGAGQVELISNEFRMVLR